MENAIDHIVFMSFSDFFCFLDTVQYFEKRWPQPCSFYLLDSVSNFNCFFMLLMVKLYQELLGQTF